MYLVHSVELPHVEEKGQGDYEGLICTILQEFSGGVVDVRAGEEPGRA